ncbi:MAG: hypothetical protein Q8M32_11630, partial [Brevundimonas sp.]|nr:hypothetical protein [Brevundimonas sp.]
DPDMPEGFSGANFFPDEMERRTFYAPKGEGHEAKIRERLERWAALRAQAQDDPARTSTRSPSRSPTSRAPGTSTGGWGWS